MSMQRHSSLSVTYYDPEAEPMPEPEPTPEPPKRRGRPPGTKNKPKQTAAVKRNVPWSKIAHCLFWAAVAVGFTVSLFVGVHGWLGDSVAYIVNAVAILFWALFLHRGWVKMEADK